MTDHRDEVAQFMANYRQSREQLATVQRALLSIAESASSPDGLVTASVDSVGALTRLTIDDEAYRRYRPRELGALIVEASRAAGKLAAARAADALAPVLPVDSDPEALLGGRADLTSAELAPAPSSSLPDADSYEETTWMDMRS
jgi:DNA-binding protein YbaB